MEDTGSIYGELAQKQHYFESIVGKILAAKRARLSKASEPIEAGTAEAFGRTISELSTEAAVALVDLRRINRTILTLEDSAKSETESAKAPVESTTLVLNNFQYEVNHYSKAIKACREFRTKYPEIELVELEEFLREAPSRLREEAERGQGGVSGMPLDMNADASEEEGSTKTAAQMKAMIPRLHFELLQRKQLAKQRQELEMRRRTLQQSIDSRKKFLASLPVQLKVLKTASQPLQQHLQVPHSQRLKQIRMANLLPQPLYILFTQMLAYQGSLSEGESALDVAIEGSIPDAEALHGQDITKLVEDLKEVEGAAPEEEEGAAKRRRKGHNDGTNGASARAGSSDDVPALSALLKAIDCTHPLSVVVSLFDTPDSQESQPSTQPEVKAAEKRSPLVTVRFRFLLRLRAVTAEALGEELSFLVDLFPADAGVDWPNVSTSSLAQPLLPSLPLSRSRPFQWCQHLAALDVLPELPSGTLNIAKGNSAAVGAETPSRGLEQYRKQHRVGTVLTELLRRKHSREALKMQLQDLSALNVALAPSSSVSPWPRESSAVPDCKLISWTELKLEGLGLRTDSLSDAVLPANDLLTGSAAEYNILCELLTSDSLCPSRLKALTLSLLSASGMLPKGGLAPEQGLTGVRIFKGILRKELKQDNLDIGFVVFLFPGYPIPPPIFAFQVLASPFPEALSLPEAPADVMVPEGQENGTFPHPLRQPNALQGLQQEVNLAFVAPGSNVGDQILTQQLKHAMILLN